MEKRWNSHRPRLGIRFPPRLGGPIVHCDVTPVPGSFPLGRRADESPRRRVTEPTSRQARERQENRAHLVRTGPNDHSRRTTRMRCPDTAVFRLSPPLVARPLTTLGHSQWPEPPGFADATAISPAAAKELSPSRDSTIRPLWASPRRP